jgi:hypothetical protein
MANILVWRLVLLKSHILGFFNKQNILLFYHFEVKGER